jgi:uncharacterized protein (TIGR03067 family)
MRRTLLLLVGLVIVPGLQADPENKELQVFQGRWAVDRLEENGVPVPAEELKKFSITVTGTRMVITMDGRDETMDFKIDPSTTPKNIDVTSNFGEDKGKTAHGIYEFDNGTLSICACYKGDRPKKIGSDAGVMLLILKRP